MAGKQKKRRWPDEEKRSICFQTTAPGVSVAQVARRYAMNANLAFKWLKDERYAPDADAVPEEPDPVFLPVEVEVATSPVLALATCQRRTKIPPLAGVKIHHFARLQVCPQTRLAQCLPQHRSYAGLWSSRIVWEWSGVQGLIALLQPITVTVHLQDMNMMCQPI